MEPNESSLLVARGVKIDKLQYVLSLMPALD